MSYTIPLATAYPAASLRREIDRLFGDAFPPRPTEGAWQPSASGREDADGYTLTLDIPGIDPEAVEVFTEDGVLTVKGARALGDSAEGEKILFAEQTSGSFTRRFRLPKSADLQQVTASYAFGVLTVRVAKLVPAQPRRVPVNTDRPPAHA